jgi:hypothetical protein
MRYVIDELRYSALVQAEFGGSYCKVNDSRSMCPNVMCSVKLYVEMILT